MCDPVTVAVGTMAIGTGVSAVGQLKAGAEAQRAANANANQLYMRTEEVREKEKFDIDQLKREFERKQGTNRARISGAGLNEATFADVLADDAAESFLERRAISWNADSEIRGLNYQAKAEIREGKNARTASYLNAGSTVLTGISNGVTMRSQFASNNLGASDPSWSYKLK